MNTTVTTLCNQKNKYMWQDKLKEFNWDESNAPAAVKSQISELRAMEKKYASLEKKLGTTPQGAESDKVIDDMLLMQQYMEKQDEKIGAKAVYYDKNRERFEKFGANMKAHQANKKAAGGVVAAAVPSTGTAAASVPSDSKQSVTASATAQPVAAEEGGGGGVFWFFALLGAVVLASVGLKK